MGRPSEYSEATADKICDLLAEGGYLTDICELDEFPSYKTVRRWIAANEDFAKNIARAGEDQADYFRWRISKLNDGMNAENWQFTNAQIRNIQWMMGKIKARAYGDKLSTEVSGPGGGAIPLSLEIDAAYTPKLSDEGQ
jgi:hypothetical protein